MRIAFNIALLSAAIFYTWFAFSELSLLTSNGRLGPGFFPRVIGVALVVTGLYSFAMDWRDRLASRDEPVPFLKDIVIFTGLAVAFVALLNVLGGFWAMVVFMLAALSIYNRGRHLQNVLVSVLLPVALFLLFSTWLNAAMPEGLIPFPR